MREREKNWQLEWAQKMGLILHSCSFHVYRLNRPSFSFQIPLSPLDSLFLTCAIFHPQTFFHVVTHYRINCLLWWLPLALALSSPACPMWRGGAQDGRV